MMTEVSRPPEYANTTFGMRVSFADGQRQRAPSREAPELPALAAAGWVVLVLAVVLAFILGVGSYYGGDGLVLSASQARPVDEQSAPQLTNVVRELTLAAGVPMPKVYIIEDSAPNAFATSRDPEHASVAITTGLLDKLDREELQGVIGHELSHVRNYDIRFALLVAVLVGSIALLAEDRKSTRLNSSHQ